MTITKPIHIKTLRQNGNRHFKVTLTPDTTAIVIIAIKISRIAHFLILSSPEI